MSTEPQSEPDSEEPDFRDGPVGRWLRPRTSAEMRVSGLVGLLLGGVLLLLGALLAQLSQFRVGEKTYMVTGGFVLLGYVAMMNGLYRLVTGKAREQARQGILWSLLRITLGVLFLVGGTIVFLFILALMSRPND